MTRAQAPDEGAPVLSQTLLQRTALRRQGLLERLTQPLPAAVDAVGGLQTQYAPSGYVGLWTRLAGFRRDHLTAALEDRSVVQATLMRTTIHIVSREAFWLWALGVRAARRMWALRLPGAQEHQLVERADQVRAALQDGPRSVRDLGELGAGFVGNLGLWVDLVRVPPSGTWDRRRADVLDLAESWIGPPPAELDEAAGRRHLVAAYLRAFGPAAWADMAAWSGVRATDLRSAATELQLVPYRDTTGRRLVDLAGLPLEDADTRAPVRFLPHWDALLLAHARRTGILPEPHRPRVFSTRNPFSVGAVLVDGRAVAAWSVRDRRIVVDPFEDIPPSAARAMERERQALEDFHA